MEILYNENLGNNLNVVPEGAEQWTKLFEYDRIFLRLIGGSNDGMNFRGVQ